MIDFSLQGQQRQGPTTNNQTQCRARTQRCNTLMLHQARIDGGTATFDIVHCRGTMVFRSQSPQVAHKKERHPLPPGSVLEELLTESMDMLCWCSHCSSSESAWEKGMDLEEGLNRRLVCCCAEFDRGPVSQPDGRMKRWKRASSLRVRRFTIATGNSIISSSPGLSLAPPSMSSTKMHSTSLRLEDEVPWGDISNADPMPAAAEGRGAVAKGGSRPSSQESLSSCMSMLLRHRELLAAHLSAYLQNPAANQLRAGLSCRADARASRKPLEATTSDSRVKAFMDPWKAQEPTL